MKFPTTLQAPHRVNDGDVVSKLKALALLWSDSQLLALSMGCCCILSSSSVYCLSFSGRYNRSASSLVGLQHRRGCCNLLLNDGLPFWLESSRKLRPPLMLLMYLPLAWSGVYHVILSCCAIMLHVFILLSKELCTYNLCPPVSSLYKAQSPCPNNSPHSTSLTAPFINNCSIHASKNIFLWSGKKSTLTKEMWEIHKRREKLCY